MKKLFLLLAALLLSVAALVACGGEDDTSCKHTNVEANPDGPRVVEATCFQEGVSAEMICKDCGKVVEESKTIAKLPHPAEKYVFTAAEEATCQKTGKTSGIKCGVCDETVVKFDTIAKKEHTPINTPKKEATATEDGHEGGTHCANCYIPLTASTPIPAGHSHGIPSAERTHLEITKPAVAPTCQADGKTAEVKCTICNKIVQDDTAIAATGHNLVVTAEAVAATCVAMGKTAAYKCANTGCDYTEASVDTDVNKNNHPVANWELVPEQAPTCNKDGFFAGIKCTATGCPSAGEPFHRPVNAQRPAHTFKVHNPAVAPNCATGANGKTAVVKCSVEGCGYTEGGDVIEYEHNMKVTTPAVDPNCATETNGTTAISTCQNTGCTHSEGGAEIIWAHDMKVVEPETETTTAKKECQFDGCDHTEGGEPKSAE